jgi:hypothetical protein
MRVGKRQISKRLLWVVVPVVIVLGGAGAAFAAGTLSFTDIAGSAHEQSIVKEAAQGVAGGYPDGTFRPDQPVTRGQMMTFLDRYNSGITCTQCHNEGTELVARQSQMKDRSIHGTGVAFEEGERTACAGCHGSEGAKARINAGLPPHDKSVAAIENVSPMGCRTCHNVHKTYTDADYALTGDEKPVKMEYTAGTFDKGAGNLCANCHQIRNPKPTVADGKIAVTSARFGTHYGTQAQMLLGEGGLGVTGSPSPHYTTVTDSCVTCHMGNDFNHTMDPGVLNMNVTPNQVTRCVGCHTGLTTLDRDKVQTDVQAMLVTAKAALVKAGIMNEADELAKTGTYSEAVANAFWNYKIVAYDASKGVHNPAYAKALLKYVIDNVK